VVTGSGAPTAGFIYKLVARARHPGGDCEPVAKTSTGKVGRGGAKSAARRVDDRGTATAEILYVGGPAPRRDDERPLLVPLIVTGERVDTTSLLDAREHHARVRGQLPDEAHRLQPGRPVLETVYEEVQV
jgi:nicotinate phosphoribosyltransferase